MPDDSSSGEPSPSAEPSSAHVGGHSGRWAAIRRPPLWLQWVLAVLVFGGAGAGLVIALHSGMPGYQTDRSAAIRADREARIVVEQDQRPRGAPLGRSVVARVALQRAIAADTRGRVRRGELTGRERLVRCMSTGAQKGRRRAFRCSALVGDVRYPFLGVADLRTRRLTWCKRDPAPQPALDVPVSRRCRA